MSRFFCFAWTAKLARLLKCCLFYTSYRARSQSQSRSRNRSRSGALSRSRSRSRNNPTTTPHPWLERWSYSVDDAGYCVVWISWKVNIAEVNFCYRVPSRRNIIIIGILGRVDSAVNFRPYPPFIQAPAYIQLSVHATNTVTEAPVVGRVARPSGDRDSNLPTRTIADWKTDALTTRPPNPQFDSLVVYVKEYAHLPCTFSKSLINKITNISLFILKLSTALVSKKELFKFPFKAAPTYLTMHEVYIPTE